MSSESLPAQRPREVRGHPSVSKLHNASLPRAGLIQNAASKHVILAPLVFPPEPSSTCPKRLCTPVPNLLSPHSRICMGCPSVPSVRFGNSTHFRRLPRPMKKELQLSSPVQFGFGNRTEKCPLPHSLSFLYSTSVDSYKSHLCPYKMYLFWARF